MPQYSVEKVDMQLRWVPAPVDQYMGSNFIETDPTQQPVL